VKNRERYTERKPTRAWLVTNKETLYPKFRMATAEKEAEHPKECKIHDREYCGNEKAYPGFILLSPSQRSYSIGAQRHE
jgi:hypothetical protein